MATTKATTLAHTIASTTSSTADLDYAKTLNDTGVTSTEFDKLDGLTATTDELNLVDGSVSGPLSHRNMIINGAMQVAQRGTSQAGVTSSGYFTTDRFKNAVNALGTWTSEQSTDAPADFKYSHKMTCTTADASPSATDYVIFQYAIEGQDLAHLNYGSSDAKELTLSFWVKSNKTGTIGLETQTSTSHERTVNVTINSADTWEYKTVYIPANTAYSTNEDNTLGLSIYWWINAGSTYKGTPTSTWGAHNSGRAGTLTSNIGTAVNDYIAITGVQLELGSVATPFEMRSYGEELARCQRYFYKCTKTAYALGRGNGTSNLADCGLHVAVPMRDTDNLTFDGTGNWYAIDSGSYVNGTNAGFTPTTGVEHGIIISGQVSGLNSMTDNRFGMVLFASGYSFHSEL